MPQPILLLVSKFTFGYLQSLDGRYIMERLFIKVNENIETHIAARKEERLLTLLTRTLGFWWSIESFYRYIQIVFVNTRAQQKPMRSSSELHTNPVQMGA